jgi:FtsP/CotA-like multicopper oxidase with cupredoxin domain
MVRIGLVARRMFPVGRRALLGALGVAALLPRLPARGLAADASKTLLLRATVAKIALRPGHAETPIWSLESPTPGLPLRFKQGDRLEITLQNDLPAPIALNLRGLDGVPTAEPLAACPAIAPAGKVAFSVLLRHAGSLLCDIRLLGDEAGPPSRSLPMLVEEANAISDRDEMFLVEDWRLRADGTTIAPGSDPADTLSLLTVNGQLLSDFAVRAGERLRFRFINGCQRQVIAVKIEGHEVRIMALDGQPSEPFMARNSQLVLPPGGRADTLIDAMAPPGSTSAILLHDGKTARAIARLAISTEPPLRAAPLPPAPPLPSNDLPAQLDLKHARRVDVPLAGTDWVRPAAFATSLAPAVRAKAGAVVVLALTNRAATATVFHLHGHHFRLLDRLDDGWKPYWLDTLALAPGQTERIAFAAEHAGRWLMESAGTDWNAPRLLRWYSVE